MLAVLRWKEECNPVLPPFPAPLPGVRTGSALTNSNGAFPPEITELCVRAEAHSWPPHAVQSCKPFSCLLGSRHSVLEAPRCSLLSTALHNSLPTAPCVSFVIKLLMLCLQHSPTCLIHFPRTGRLQNPK